MEFKEVAKLFITIFKRHALKEVTDILEKTIKDKSFTPKNPQRNPKENILNILKEQPTLSIREIAEQSGMSVYSVQHQINRLKEDGVIKHEGPTKGGRWECISGEPL